MERISFERGLFAFIVSVLIAVIIFYLDNKSKMNRRSLSLIEWYERKVKTVAIFFDPKEDLIIEVDMFGDDCTDLQIVEHNAGLLWWYHSIYKTDTRSFVFKTKRADLLLAGLSLRSFIDTGEEYTDILSKFFIEEQLKQEWLTNQIQKEFTKS